MYLTGDKLVRCPMAESAALHEKPREHGFQKCVAFIPSLVFHQPNFNFDAATSAGLEEQGCSDPRDWTESCTRFVGLSFVGWISRQYQNLARHHG
jgi:hypothetical protein